MIFTDRISRWLPKPEKKFTADITYGMLASGSCFLSLGSKRWVLEDTVIHIDDSDVVKSSGYKFELLGIVRDGSANTSKKIFMKKDTTLQRPVFLQPAIILSVFSLGLSF